MASRVELARDQIVTALRGITVANGYRNTVANVSKAIVHPDLVSEWPHLCVELGKSTIQYKNDVRTLFDELTEVFIVGFVRSNTETTIDIDAISYLQEAMESMIHDLKKKVCTDLLTVSINSETNKWNVELSSNKLDFTRTSMLGMGKNIGIVETNFTLRIRASDADFDEDFIELFAENGDNLVTESGDLLIAG
jgi:hypothetical protein